MALALLGFEESQTVTIALRAKGIEAFSCDLKECSGGHPEWHLQMDIYKALHMKKWNFIGLHPVCTAMTLSGNRTYAKGKPKHSQRLESVNWTIDLWEHTCKLSDFVYMENPMGAMNGNPRLPKAQIIQPYYFGDEYQKTTCLWLKNLPHLFHNKTENLFGDKVTHVDRGEMWVAKSGKVMPKWFAKTASTNNEGNRTIRSKTFPGIAAAMADQWSALL